MAAVSGEAARTLGFTAVYDAEALAVTRLAFLLVRSRALSEELAHDAFVRLYERFDEVENPAGFLRTAVVRLAITAQGRRRMERERLRALGGTMLRQTTDSPEVDEAWAALGRLRPERRTVLVLRFYADMAYDDIAAAVGCSASTARSRARRALADLRKELTP